MKFFKIITSTKWIAVWLSVFTMTLSPLAMGQEAQRISTAQVKNALAEMGLNQKITVGEFYQKSKHLYPERIRLQIEPVLMNFKNTLMPEFSVTTVKGNNGKEIANIAVTYQGQLINLQWFGEKDKYLKFQNTNLSEIDLINFDDMFKRLLAGDESFRKQMDARTEIKNPNNAAVTKFEYPVVNKEIWKSMTPQDRANYMINLRLLWNEAQNVLNQTNSKKTTSINKFERIWQTLFEQPADAKTKAGSDKIVKPVSVAGNSATCLVAGYVTTNSSTKCAYKNIKADYLEIPDVKEANRRCGEGKLACNPIVFGAPGGNPICLSPSEPSFKIATHYNGPCETIKLTGKNHLGSEVKFLKDEFKRNGRYDPKNILVENIKKEVEKEQNGKYDATKDFLNGLLKLRGSKEDLFSNGKIDEETLAKIRQIKNQFEEDIETATASCKASSNEALQKDKNFWKACDQLQRRFIFVEEYLQLQCPIGSKINSGYKCTCGDPAKPAEVMPGEKECKPAVVPPTPATPAPPVQVNPPVTPGTSVGCPPGQIKKEITGAGPSEGAVATDCVPIRTPSRPTESTGSGVWDFLKKLAPLAVVGAVGYGMYKLFVPKKPALNPAADLCPNGTKAPCGQICKLPQVMQSGGGCGCSACPPGQKSDDICNCTSGEVPAATTLITCADGTKVPAGTKCPDLSFTCWDGTKVPKALNCPEMPATVTPSTTK